jgi:hypothetical protein
MKTKNKRREDMFVEFERTDTTGRPNGPVWVNTNSVFTLENYKDSVTEKNLDTGELYSKHVVVEQGITTICGADRTVMVLGDIHDTLSKLNDV